MNLTNNGKATIAYTVALALVPIYIVTAHLAIPEWLAASELLGTATAPVAVGVVLPLSLLLLTTAASAVWQGKRWGYFLVIGLAVFAILDAVTAVPSRLGAGLPLATSPFVFEFLVAVLVIWFSYKGQRELATEQS